MATSKRKPFSIVLTIAVNSITTGVEERDSHRKGADFFDVAKYPAITFVSTSVSKRHVVFGDGSRSLCAEVMNAVVDMCQWVA